MKIDVTLIPEDNFKDNDFRVKVLFVPGPVSYTHLTLPTSDLV